MRAAAGQIAAIGVGYGLVVGFLDTEAGPIAWLLTVGTLVVIAVITGLLRRRVETQLAETLAKNERLIEADRLKDEFLATISHELRTPLTSIRGYLDLTLEDEERRLSSEQRSFLEVIDRNSARLLQQVTDLLLVAQIQAGTISVDRRQLDLAELGEAAIGRHGTAASAHGVSLSLETLPLQPVAGDPTRIAQLLDVLLSNAIKFTPDGGSVRLQIRPVAEGVEIEVADTGVGVADSDRQRLFERFYRASGVTDRAVPGTGIGLTIARGIAEAHDGSIECTSVEGVGSTFRVVLPSGGAR
jgi:signal transduction histidine kinase